MENLGLFTGGGIRFRHPLFRSVLYTEGVQYVAEKGQAFWLIDDIAAHIQSPEMKKAINEVDFRLSEMQFWTLEKRPDSSARLYCQADSDEPMAIEQEIRYTDFPMDDIKIWAAFDGQHWTLYLPSEH